MNNIDPTIYFLEKLEAVWEKYEQLEHLRAVIAPVFWEKVRETIETEAATTQSLKLPVLFFLLDRRDIETLQSLDQFLGYLRKSSDKRHQKEISQLASRLQKRIGYRHAVGALFEMEILTCLLENNPEGSVELYPQIRNRNFPEASIILGGKTVYFEATIRSQSEEQERDWEIGFSSSPVVFHYGDPQGDARRIIRRIKDKQSQQVARALNILCIGLPDFSTDTLILKSKVTSAFEEEPQLTGLLVFRGGQSSFLPEEKFINPSPHPDSQLSEEEWQTILDWFGFSSD